MTFYKDIGIIDRKPRRVIVDGHRKIINKYPSKEELKSIAKWNFKHNDTETCDDCGISFDKIPGHPLREKDKEGKETGGWICVNCWYKDYKKNDPNSTYNIIKSLANCRTGNQKPGSNKEKGNRSQKLINILENFEDLNKKNNNFNSIVDSIDPITGLKYQIQGRSYDSMRRRWDFGKLNVEWYKDFVSIFFVCFSKDWNIVERIYIIPKEEIEYKITNISIYKYDSKGLPYEGGWYEQYKKDEEYIKKANEMYNNII